MPVGMGQNKRISEASTVFWKENGRGGTVPEFTNLTPPPRYRIVSFYKGNYDF